MESRKKVRLKRETSVLLLDADGNGEFARQVFGDDLREIRLQGEREGIFIQCYEAEQTKKYMKRLLTLDVAQEVAKRRRITMQEAFGLPEVQERVRKLCQESGRPDAFYVYLRDTVRQQVYSWHASASRGAEAVRKVMADFQKDVWWRYRNRHNGE